MVVNGKVDGPISGEDVILKSRAFVTGDIQAQSLSIERGARFDGRSLRPDVTNLCQVDTPAFHGQNERVRPALLKKEDEPKTKITAKRWHRRSTEAAGTDRGDKAMIGAKAASDQV